MSEHDDHIVVDVTASFHINAWLADYTYLGEEISTWRGGELQSLAVNQRNLVDGQAKKQQWDLFRRAGGALQAYRVQAKRLADFRERHPGFVRHWSPASFGQSWVQDYASAPPERRPDLDLPRTQGVRTPLALAFYWSRYLPAAAGSMPVFLPGFKHDALTPIAFGPPTEGQGWRRWQSELHHPGLERRPVSMAAVWVSPQSYLLQLGLDVHSSLGSGEALVRAQGCQGVQIRPDRM